MTTVHDLSYPLVGRALDAEQWVHSPAPDGSLLVVFDHGNFLVTVEGVEDEILLVTGLIDAPVAAGDLDAVDDVIDDWHRTQMWPTVNRSEAGGDGAVEVTTEVAGYFPHGASLAQVRTQLRCAVGSTQALVRRLEAALGA